MPESSLDRQLRQAIRHKRLVRFVYGGRERVAEPHDYGVQKQVLRLLVYQRRASGPQENVVGWRMLDVAKIEQLVVLEDTFRGSRGDAHERHYEWDEIYARVESS